MITESQWLGLLGVTETDHHEEFPIIMWSVRRRAEGPSRFKDSVSGVATQTLYDDVILCDWQFSAFNKYRDLADPDAVYVKIRAEKASTPVGASQLVAAENCAAWVLSSPERSAPIGPKSYYFWSPRSMVPVGSLPKWNWNNLRRFCPYRIDPWRLCCAEEL